MFKKIDEKLFKDLKDKKYFELKDYFDRNILKGVWCFFFKGKKGIGKSYCLRKIYEEIDNSLEDKILYIRTRLEDTRYAKNGFNENNDIPFKVESNKLYSKKDGTFRGLIAYANNLSSLRSGNYNNYKYIIYDEFVENNRSNYRNREFFAANFVKLVMDINRDTTDLKVLCFGNNDTNFDPFSEYFMVDSLDSKFNLDKENGIFFANLEGYYKGVVQDKKSYGLAFYDERLKDFLDSNKSYENMELFENYSKANNSIVEFYYYYNKCLFSFNRKLDNSNILIKQEIKYIDGLPVYCFNDSDNMEMGVALKMNKVQMVVEFNKWKQLIKNRIVKFLDETSKLNMLMLLNTCKISIQDL